VADQQGRIGDFVYINTTLGERAWYGSEDDPDLGNTLPTPFDKELTEDSRTALAAALGGVAIEFVGDPQSVVDPGAVAQMGCRAYLNNRPMLQLGTPLPRKSAPSTFFVEVNYDRGCGGDLYLLEVGRDAAGDYRVERIVRSGGWIV